MQVGGNARPHSFHLDKSGDAIAIDDPHGHPDYQREMAFVALHVRDGRTEQVGVARYAQIPGVDGRCEFALVVADRWQRQGLGARLMRYLIEYARQHGYRTMEGEVLSTNSGMLELVRSLGFHVGTSLEGASMRNVTLQLNLGETAQ